MHHCKHSRPVCDVARHKRTAPKVAFHANLLEWNRYSSRSRPPARPSVCVRHQSGQPDRRTDVATESQYLQCPQLTIDSCNRCCPSHLESQSCEGRRTRRAVMCQRTEFFTVRSHGLSCANNPFPAHSLLTLRLGHALLTPRDGRITFGERDNSGDGSVRDRVRQDRCGQRAGAERKGHTRHETTVVRRSDGINTGCGQR